MTIKKQLAHNTLAQLAGKIVSTILGLIAIAILTRYLGVERFGWYATTLAFLQFIAILLDFGLTPVTAQMMSEVPKEITEENKEKLAHYRAVLMKNLLGFRFTTAVIGLGLAPAIALFFPYPYEVKVAITFTTISMLSVAMNQIFLGFYQSKLSTYFQAIGEVLGRIVLIAGLLLCIHFDLGFIPTMWAIVISSVAYTLVLWIHAKKSISVSLAFDFSIWKKIAIKMWPIAVSIMFNVIYLRGDVVLLSVFRDQIEVGLYGAAYRVIDIIAQTAMMIMGLMLPLLAYAWSTGDDKKFKEHFELAFNVMVMFAVPMAIGLSVLSREIVTVIAGEAFRDAALPLAMLSVAVFGVFIGAVFGHVAVAINRQKETLPVYIITALITLFLYLIFIPRFGMLGAAGASVFSELCAGICLYMIIKKYAHISLSPVFTLKILLAGSFMASTLYLLKTHLALAIITGSAVYGLAILATRAISLSTIREIVSFKK